MIKLKTKILITGGAGFIGSHLTNKLLSLGHQVIVVDNLSKGKKENINRHAHFIKVDICSQYFLKVLKETKPDFLFHLAAQTSLVKSIKNPRKDLQVNLFATLNLLESLKKNSLKKIIFASSTAVYGPTKLLPIEEEMPKAPISTYGLGKLTSEYFFKNYYRQHNIPYVCLRYANVYGENQDESAEGGVIAIFINRILRNQTVYINSDGKQTRDFIYISDVILADLAVLNKKIIGEFNVGTGIQTSINQLYEKLVRISNKKSKKEYKALPYLEVPISALSYSKLLNTVGWKPRISLEEGLKITYEHFKLKMNLS